VGEPSVALVVVSSPFEAGGDRAEPALRRSAEILRDSGLNVHAASQVIWDVADASRVTKEWADARIDLLVIVHASWVEDSLQFQLQREARAPVLLWTLPYPDTYALAAAKHFASVASRTGISCKWGQGEVDDPDFLAAVEGYAGVAAVASRFRRSRVALLTPRTAWRTFGPMDMSYDEWDLANSLGVTLLHLELDELIDKAENESDASARAELDRHAAGYGHIEADAERMLFSSKVYLAARKMIDAYGLDAMAAACYPTHFGLVNVASSWMSDERFHFDPEGDAGSAIVANAMLALHDSPVCLAEPVLLRRERDSLFLRHEGSAPSSLAASPSEVYVSNLGDQRGTVIEFPLRRADKITAACIAGRSGEYALYVGELKSLGIPTDEWQQWGRGFLADVTGPKGGTALIEGMFANGQDHHMLLQEGDQVAQLTDLAALWGLEVVSIGGSSNR
jgi:L-fucose isomerase-like protein